MITTKRVLTDKTQYLLIYIPQVIKVLICPLWVQGHIFSCPSKTWSLESQSLGFLFISAKEF